MSLTTPSPRMPWPSGPIAPQPERRSRRVTAAGAVLAALVVVGLVVWWMGRDRVSFPDVVGGLSRVSSRQADELARQFRGMAESEQLEGDIAFYGTGTSPSVVLFWIRDPSNSDLETVFQAFGSGFVSGVGGAELTGQSGQTVEGVLYLCAPFGGQGVAGALCMWKDADLYWVLLDAAPDAGPEAARELAVQAEHEVA